MPAVADLAARVRILERELAQIRFETSLLPDIVEGIVGQRLALLLPSLPGHTVTRDMPFNAVPGGAVSAPRDESGAILSSICEYFDISLPEDPDTASEALSTIPACEECELASSADSAVLGELEPLALSPVPWPPIVENLRIIEIDCLADLGITVVPSWAPGFVVGEVVPTRLQEHVAPQPTSATRGLSVDRVCPDARSFAHALAGSHASMDTLTNVGTSERGLSYLTMASIYMPSTIDVRGIAVRNASAANVREPSTCTSCSSSVDSEWFVEQIKLVLLDGETDNSVLTGQYASYIERPRRAGKLRNWKSFVQNTTGIPCTLR